MIPILRPSRRRDGPTRIDEAHVGRNLRAGWLGILSIAVLLLASCGRKGGGDVTEVQVHGKVTHKGAALPGGTIAFVPDVELGGSGDIASVEIKPDGSYSLATAPGWYRITVTGPPSSRVSACYADPELCQLSFEVKSGSVNVHDIPLN